MQASQKAIDLIKFYEGFRSKPYLCPAGIPTIGYGTTHYPDGRRVTLEDDPISETTATSYMMHDVSQAQAAVDKAVKVQLTQGQYDAMVCIMHNIGPGISGTNGRDGITILRSGQPSTLLRKLNNGDYAGAAEQFERWVFGGGVKLSGLEKRRKQERALFEGK